MFNETKGKLISVSCPCCEDLTSRFLYKFAPVMASSVHCSVNPTWILEFISYSNTYIPV